MWNRYTPAHEDQIKELVRQTPFELPTEYLDLLRYSDGGFGDLDLPPLGFVLDSVAESIAYNTSDMRKRGFPDHWFFGGNGGLEIIGFDLRNGPPWTIVTIDPISGPDRALVIARTMAEFITKIGIRPKNYTP